MNTSETIGVILLAAGSSSRLGRPKQLIHFQGQSLLQRSIDSVPGTGLTPKLVVLGANSPEISAAVKLNGFTIVHNEEWQEGIASSIRAGVSETVKLNPNIAHILFMLSDQPFVSIRLIEELISVHKKSGKRITASEYQGDFGVPAIFSKSLIPELLGLAGDQGAKQIMKRYPDEVAFVNFESGYIDLDTPDDYERLLELDV